MPSYITYKTNLKAILDADDTEIESWITVRGNHIPIKKGQSKEEAVKSFLEKKGQSAVSKSEPKSNKQEAGYGALEIAYNMEFGNNAAKNKSALLKEIKESGEKNAKSMIAIVENMEEKHFESQEAFRKGIKNAKKTDNGAKNKLYGINNSKQVFSIKGGRVVVDPELKTANWYNSNGALTLKQKDLDTDAFIKHGVNELGWQKMSEKEESVLKEFQKIANKPEYKDKEVEAGFEMLPKDYTIAHKDKNGKTTVIAEVSHHDINKKK